MALVQQDLARFEGMTAEEVLAWALGEFFPSISEARISEGDG